MLGLFKQITDPVNECSCTYDSLSIIGKNICLSGDFDFGSKADIAKLLTSIGAYIHETVKRDTDFLIVGGQGSDAWAAGNYGNKVKKALEMQAKGNGIKLLREADFLAALGG